MTVYGSRIALKLTELGAQLVAQRYRREHPEASEEEVRRAVAEWFMDRSQAPQRRRSRSILPVASESVSQLQGVDPSGQGTGI